jgi:two-component system chemotaxis response regulator CheY
MRTGRILVVEDDELLREALAEVLTDDGHEVRTATNGAEALGELERWEAEVIVLDLMMPVLDGFAFRDEQRRRDLRTDVPVLVLSAVRDLDGAAERIAAAASLPKPFRLEDVLASVSALLGARAAEGGAAR